MKKIDFVEYSLENKLKCILHKDNNFPVINLMIGYKVGSKDEPVGKKGLAHLFEHLMFQGSENIKKNEHFRIIQNSGGECNAFTNQDITVYYETMPSNFLEISLWLESDRMAGLDLTEENLENQKDVVIEEKLSSYDNAPYGTAFPNILKSTFNGSNYQIATIGNENDIRSLNVDEAVNFHNKYYSPSNAVLILSGDFEYGKAEKLIERYFNSINKPVMAERNPNIVPELQENQSLIYFDNVNLPVLYICFRIPKVGNFEDYTLEYFTNIMANNRSSILYKNLVYEKKLLNYIYVSKHQMEDAGILLFVAMLNGETGIEYIESEIYNSINEFYQHGIKETDYQKIKNKIEYYITTNFSVLMNINSDLLYSWFFYKDLNRINDKINKYLSVRKEDVLKTMNDYLINKPKVVVQYLPHKKIE